MKSKRILIIDDNPDQVATLTELLRSAGHRVECATSALYALTFARDFQPEFAFVDIAMPMMDGYETARRLKHHFNAPRMFAITGTSGADIEAKSRSAGFEAHLFKPVDFSVIEKLLES